MHSKGGDTLSTSVLGKLAHGVGLAHEQRWMKTRDAMRRKKICRPCCVLMCRSHVHAEIRREEGKKKKPRQAKEGAPMRPLPPPPFAW